MDKKYLQSIAESRELWDLYTFKNEYGSITPKYEGTAWGRLMVPQVSKHLLKNGYRASYPEGKGFAICLSHDVDDIYPPLTHKALASLYSLKDLNFRQMNKYLFWEFRGQKSSPYINFQQIIELEKKYGAKSTFYCMAADRDPRRFRYNIEEITGEIQEIYNQGWDIGLHGGYYTFNDFEEMRKEKARLEKTLQGEVLGYRNHYLRFSVPKTWSYLERCGFKYDSTYGHNNAVGFRNGMCHPFQPRDFKSGQQFEIYEIPLHIMDGTLFGLSRNNEEAWNIARELIDQAEKCHGVLTVLWHNDAFSCPFRTRWQKTYERLLDYGRKKNAWMTSHYEIWKWWKNHDY